MTVSLLELEILHFECMQAGRNPYVLVFDLAPPQGAHYVGIVCETLRWSYSAIVVTVSLLELEILHFECMQAGRNPYVLVFDLAPPQGAHYVGIVCETLRWSYSAIVVTVSLLELEILHFECMQAGRNPYVLVFDLAPPQGAHYVGIVCETLRWSYSAIVVTVSLLELEILHFECMQAGRNPYVLVFDLAPPQGAHYVGIVCETLRWSYSAIVVTVSLLELEILHFECMQVGRNPYVLVFDLAPPPGAHNVAVVWESLRSTYSAIVLSALLFEVETLYFDCMQAAQNPYVLVFDLAPPPGAHNVGKVCETLRWSYSAIVVTVSLWELEILHFEYKRDGITDGQTDGRTDRQTDRRTDDPNTRCPRRTFQAGGIKIYTATCSRIVNIASVSRRSKSLQELPFIHYVYLARR